MPIGVDTDVQKYVQVVQADITWLCWRLTKAFVLHASDVQADPLESRPLRPAVRRG